MDKQFYIIDNVGKCKYTVNFHDGEKKYDDESPFYDIQIFKNKRVRDKFIKDLKADGYRERSSMDF